MKNYVNLIGRLGNDPESSYTPAGLHVTKFSLATWFFAKGEKHTVWHNIVAFGKTADNIEKYLKKGGLVDIDGSIRYTTYEKEGVKKYFTEIVGVKVRFLSPATPAVQNSQSPMPENHVPENFSGDDDIPF